MIVEWLLGIFGPVIAWVLGWVQFPDVPDFMADLPGYFSTVLGFFADTDAWIPWPVIGAVAAAVGGVFVVAVGIKLARIVASFLTLGGGSAA